MKKQMKRKIKLALKKLSDNLTVEHAIEIESILNSDFVNSLDDLKKFKEIIIERKSK